MHADHGDAGGGGETFRELARAYGVAHTTLSRYFARPDVAKQLKQAEQLMRAELRAAEAGGRVEQRAEPTPAVFSPSRAVATDPRSLCAAPAPKLSRIRATPSAGRLGARNSGEAIAVGPARWRS